MGRKYYLVFIVLIISINIANSNELDMAERMIKDGNYEQGIAKINNYIDSVKNKDSITSRNVMNILSQCYYLIGYAYHYQNEVYNAKDYYLKSLEYANRELSIKLYSNIASLFTALDKVDSARYYFSQGLQLCHKSDYEYVSLINNKIAELYIHLDDNKRALEYLNNTFTEKISTLLRYRIFINYAEVFMNTGDYKFYEYIHYAEALAAKYDYDMAYLFILQAKYNIKYNDIDKALAFIKKGYYYTEKYNLKKDLITLYMLEYQVTFQIECLFSAERIAKENIYNNQLYNIYKNIAEYYKNNAMYKQSNLYYMNANNILESLNNHKEKTTSSLFESLKILSIELDLLKTRYGELDLKNSIISDKLFYYQHWFYIILLLSFIIVFYLLYNRLRSRLNISIQERENILLLSTEQKNEIINKNNNIDELLYYINRKGYYDDEVLENCYNNAVDSIDLNLK